MNTCPNCKTQNVRMTYREWHFGTKLLDKGVCMYCGHTDNYKEFLTINPKINIMNATAKTGVWNDTISGVPVVVDTTRNRITATFKTGAHHYDFEEDIRISHFEMVRTDISQRVRQSQKAS